MNDMLVKSIVMSSDTMSQDLTADGMGNLTPTSSLKAPTL